MQKPLGIQHPNFRIHGFKFIAFSLTLFALILRLYQLGSECLWMDEGFSIETARRIWESFRIEPVRPLYHLFLALWMQIGQSEFILRLPSALFGSAAVLVLCFLGKHIVGERASIIAATLMAVSPLHVNHSQEVRMYALTSLLTLLAMYWFILFLRKPRLRYIALCLVFDLLSVAAFPLSALLLVVQNMVLVLRARGVALRRWLFAEAVILVAIAPIVIRTAQASFQISPDKSLGPSFLQVFELVGGLSLMSRGPAGSATAHAFDTYVFTTFLLIGFVVYMGWRRQEFKSDGWQYSLLLMWLFVPLLVTALLAEIVHTQWLPRYLIYAAPAYFLLLGKSVESLPTQRLKYLAVVLVLAMPTLRLVRYYQRVDRPDWRTVVAFLEDQVRPGDLIAVYRPGNGNLFAYYYQGNVPWVEIGYPMLQKPAPWTNQRVAKILNGLPDKCERVWLVMSMYDPKAPPAIKRYVRDKYKILGTKSFVQVQLLWFETGNRLSDQRLETARLANHTLHNGGPTRIRTRDQPVMSRPLYR